MNRSTLIAALAQPKTYDLAIIGGGATGLGVALDAAARGFSVVLVESHDFAKGTSSRATKLVHGGVRYLAQGNISLVREALHERSTLLANAPHLAQPLPFVMPSYRVWEAPFYGIGLKMYDALAGKAGLGDTEFLNRAETLRYLPNARVDGPNGQLRGGVKYWDGQFDDARLALALARSAQAAGARVLNYAEVTAIRQASGETEPVSTLDVTDRRTGARLALRARCVVNATGVWVDALRDRTQPAASAQPSRMVSPSQGVHVVVDRDFMPGGHALLVPRTRDGRVLFAVPWLGKLVLGTTDTPRKDLPREPDAFAQELDFILAEAGQALSRPVRREDIRSLWVGLRPLVAPPEAAEGSTQTLSREHTIVVDPNGLVTVTGGKWTTYRAMAEDVLERCFASQILPRRPPGLSATHRLIGAGTGGEAPTPLYEPPGLHLYGSEAAEVQKGQGAGRLLGMGLSEAMVR
ncbi:MAG: glycerol-3-phosphate dehydrogenase/oxidase, partial [Comamonadaceae bacterium]